MRIGNFAFATKHRLAARVGAAFALASGVALAKAENAEPLAPFAPPPSALLQLVDASSRTVSSGANDGFFARQKIPSIVALIWARPRADAGDGSGAPLALALRARVNASSSAARSAERRAIAAFYAARAHAPLWSANGRWTVAALRALQRLRAAAEDGLDPRAYRLPVADAPTDEDELDLSEAVVAYAEQASGSRVDPGKISRLIGMRPVLPAPGDALALVSGSGEEAGDVLRGFNPHHPGYRALAEKLAELRAARSGGERVARLRAGSGGETASDDSPRSEFSAVAPETLARVEAEIVANMERWRWAPREQSPNRLEVNIPAFELALLRDNAVAYRSRVIVGKPSTPTPMFSNAMRFVVVNPYWNVPPSILKNEMLARNGGDLSGLESQGFQVSYSNGRPSVRQRPGDRNALGRLKFMFPNEYSVYLHDTPSRGLFARPYRAFSHGCVRVDAPFRLAEAVLGAQGGWSEQRLRGLIGASERVVDLAEPLPVHIMYFTAFVDESGALQLRDDVYGYSAKVRRALGL